MYDTILESAMASEIDTLRDRLSKSKRDNRTNRDRLRSENKKLRAKLVVLENALRGYKKSGYFFVNGLFR